MIHEVFAWCGEPIHDIKKWAADRGERMVKYEAKRFDPWLNDYYIEHGEMPESFWNNLAWTDGWSYREIENE